MDGCLEPSRYKSGKPSESHLRKHKEIVSNMEASESMNALVHLKKQTLNDIDGYCCSL